MPFQRRDIVIADIPDPQGRPCQHRHPAMILMAQDGYEDVYVIGISTSFSPPVPAHWIALPFSEEGHPDTGLREPCVLKCDWVVPFRASQLSGPIGKVSQEVYDRATNIILARIEQRKMANQAQNRYKH